MDINKIFTSLERVENQILDAVDNLNQISKDAVAFGGDISRVVPQNLKATIDTLINVTRGGDQSSIKSLRDYLDNIPVSQLRKQSLTSKVINDDSLSGVSSDVGATPVINTTPNTANGPSSAIMQEDTTLEAFFNTFKKGNKLQEAGRSPDYDYYGNLMDEPSYSEQFDTRTGTRFAEYEPDDYADPNVGLGTSLSFDAIMADEDMASDLDFDPYNLNATPEPQISSFADQFMTDEFGEEFEPMAMGEEPSFDGDWRAMTKNLHPESMDFNEIMYDDRDPV